MTERRSRAGAPATRSCPSSPCPSVEARPLRHVNGVGGREWRMALVSAELEAQAIAWRRHLHANPELSFAEVETSTFVAETLDSFEGLELERPTETSVVAHLQGARRGRTLALRADLDALPVQEETGLEF